MYAEIKCSFDNPIYSNAMNKGEHKKGKFVFIPTSATAIVGLLFLFYLIQFFIIILKHFFKFSTSVLLFCCNKHKLCLDILKS